MGKLSGPKAPPAPDPYATADAQTQSNKETATANAYLNRVNQYTPYGQSTWNVYSNAPDGTPLWRNDVTLDPAQQALLDSDNKLSQNLYNTANDQVGRVSEAFGTGIDMSQLPGLRSQVNMANLPRVGNAPVPGELSTTFGATNPIQSSLQGYQYNTQLGDAGPIQSSLAPAGQIQNSVAPSTMALTNRIADVGSQQRTIDGAMPGLYGGNVQSQLNLNGLSQLPGINDFGAERNRVEQALYGRATSRLDPRFQQEQSGLENRLVNMGIARGSAAWNREMENFGRTKNDAYSTAMQDMILAGGQEQSRLFADALSGRQQGFTEAMGSGQFANQADLQKYNYAMGSRQQTFNEGLARSNVYNQAQANDFSQQALRSQFTNDAAGQQFGQNLAAGQFANQAQNQQFNQNLSAGSFANTAQQQRYDQNLGTANFANDALKAQFEQGKSQGEFYNNSQAQDFAQQAARQAFSNDAVTQNFGNNMASNAQQATLRGQMFAEQMAGLDANNNARAQAFQEAAYNRNLPIQDIAALIGTAGGVQQPQFGSVPNVSQDGTDIMGAIYNSYNGQMNAWSQQQQARASTLGSIFGALGTGAGLAAMSDRRLKHSIRRVGETAAGIPTYVFSYIGSKLRNFGVMAQEVLDIPGAVVANDDGYMSVNYGKVWAHV